MFGVGEAVGRVIFVEVDDDAGVVECECVALAGR
jgi:hypothetical protein